MERGEIKVYLISGEQCEVRLNNRLHLGDDNPGQALAIFCLVETRDQEHIQPSVQVGWHCVGQCARLQRGALIASLDGNGVQSVRA